ncbi:MAG TPA: phosphoribosylformylglycinamidine cyclo-ligase [Candidatus Bathyarchaeia archaeon]|nr:phosphoribosylformylglycinamidine cyclo-ligase [Candidatus Bathyarchaeia archaeon]
MRPRGTSYAAAGVDTVGIETGLGRLLGRINATFDYPRRGRPVLPNGFFANVLDLGRGQGLAISTDGVGTKVLVAHALGRYDTLGLDLVAMNVNDLLCVGAEPIAMVDYIAVPSADPELLEQLAIGLAEGARQARISIPGGEIAQVRELLRPHPPDGREGVDLIATAVGLVDLERIVIGRELVPGDCVIGIDASGIHSNGLTLARRVLVGPGGGADAYRERPPEIGGATIGEELLRPTAIYVEPVMALLDAGVRVKAMAHITGDGLLNLLRVDAAGIGFVLDALLPQPAIFALIAGRGGISASEMFQTFNMGVGFCIVLPETEVARALGLLAGQGRPAQVIGRAVRDPEKRVRLPQAGLVGVGKQFLAEDPMP